MKKKKKFLQKNNPVLSNGLSVLILYFNAAKFAIRLFYFYIFYGFFCQSMG